MSIMSIIKTEIENKGGRVRYITLTHWSEGGEINMALKTGYEIRYLIQDLKTIIEQLEEANEAL